MKRRYTKEIPQNILDKTLQYAQEGLSREVIVDTIKKTTDFELTVYHVDNILKQLPREYKRHHKYKPLEPKILNEIYSYAVFGLSIFFIKKKLELKHNLYISRAKVKKEIDAKNKILAEKNLPVLQAYQIRKSPTVVF